MPISLDEARVKALITEEKKYSKISLALPFPYGKNLLPAKSLFTKMEYSIDINKARYELSKVTFQGRVYGRCPIVRIDLDTKPHRNPNQEVIDGAHIHIYKEGYDMGLAYPLDHDMIKSLNPNINLAEMISANEYKRFKLFNALCNLSNEPELIKSSLFNVSE